MEVLGQLLRLGSGSRRLLDCDQVAVVGRGIDLKVRDECDDFLDVML